MQAFVDDSGAKGQEGVLVLAGLIGRSEDWAEFADKWRSVLNLPPAIPSLHMSDAAHFEGAFKNCPRDVRDQRVHLLASIVNDYQFTAIHCSVEIAAYAEVIAASRRAGRWKDKRTRLAKVLKEPYYIAFLGMVMAVCYELLEQGINERFEIIFDQHKVLGPRVRSWYPAIVAGMEPEAQAIMPIDPVFRDDEEFVPLQAADLLAWLVRRELSGMDHSFDWIPYSMRGIEWSGHGQYWDKERLQAIVERSNRIPISDPEFQRTDRLLGLTEGRDN